MILIRVTWPLPKVILTVKTVGWAEKTFRLANMPASCSAFSGDAVFWSCHPLWGKIFVEAVALESAIYL